MPPSEEAPPAPTSPAVTMMDVGPHTYYVSQVQSGIHSVRRTRGQGLSDGRGRTAWLLPLCCSLHPGINPFHRAACSPSSLAVKPGA